MITWDEHLRLAYGQEATQSHYTKTNIMCPRCGEAIYRDDRVVLTTYPPKYRYECHKCGWFDTAPR